LVGGLTNGVSYTFTVQAIDPRGQARRQAVNAVVPSAAHVPVITAAISVLMVTTAPSQVTYQLL
jgi:hypothetical protein